MTNPIANYNTQEIINLAKKVQVLMQAPEWLACVVDADFIDAKTNCTTLEAYGFQNVEIALSGQEALDWLAKNRGSKALVFSSYQLSDMTFPDFALLVKSDPHYQNCKLILLDNDREENKTSCSKRAGAHVCFQKPLSEKQLVDLLQELTPSNK